MATVAYNASTDLFLTIPDGQHPDWFTRKGLVRVAEGIELDMTNPDGVTGRDGVRKSKGLIQFLEQVWKSVV